jgi:hypothetical protein
MLAKLKLLYVAPLDRAYLIVRQEWAKFPHQVQAAITGILMAALSSVVHAYDTGGCLTWVCIKGYLHGAVATGLASIWVFYMVPSNRVSPAGQLPAKPTPAEG